MRKDFFSSNKRGFVKKRLLWFTTVTLILGFFAFSFMGVVAHKTLLLLTDRADTSQIAEDTGQTPEITDTDQIPESATVEHSLAVTRGDTLLNMLKREGIDRGEAHAAISALRKVYDPRDLRPGQEVTVFYNYPPGDEKSSLFHGFSIRADSDLDIMAKRNNDGAFVVDQVKIELETRRFCSSGVIRSSLYESAIQEGLPIPVLMQFIYHFSFDVDFQRDIRPGDSFEVLFERHLNKDGKVVQEGPVLHAALTLRNTTLRIYRHISIEDKTDYYNEKGHTVRKTLIRTPINGARLSSGYGMRKHPILGFSRIHRGLDFAASTGTPIVASGSGVVVCAGRKGDYGKYIRLRHANQYATAYAHLSSFARGIHTGKRVKQGEVIGYVGNTGLSTGPHLHYEVHHRGRKINPASVKCPPGRVLAGEELQHFMTAKTDLDRSFAELEAKKLIASRN